MKKIGIIIPAGGVGTRMAAREAVARTPKQFMILGGRPVLARTIEAFGSAAPDAEIVVALPAPCIDEWAELCRKYGVCAHKVCEGGATRFLSIRNALSELDHEVEYIAVHDAARPLVSNGLILRTIEAAHLHGSAIPVVPVVDSVRRVDGNGISHPERREELRGVQTPQVFRADILRTAYANAEGYDWGDDATVVESVGYTVMLCEGERRNIKITEPEDMAVAATLLER